MLNLFDKWLKENGYDITPDDIDLTSKEDETLLAFKMYLHETHYADMISYMREIGIKIPITGTNWPMFPANVRTERYRLHRQPYLLL